MIKFLHLFKNYYLGISFIGILIYAGLYEESMIRV